MSDGGERRGGPVGSADAASALLSAARVAVGAVGLVRPELFARTVGVDRVTAERTAWIARMAAARDLVLGAAALGALGRGRSPAGWLRAGAASDAGDVLALGLALSGRQVAIAPAAGLMTASALAAAVGLRAAGALRTSGDAGGAGAAGGNRGRVGATMTP